MLDLEAELLEQTHSVTVHLVDVCLFYELVVLFCLLQALFHVSYDLGRIKLDLAHLLLKEARSVPHLLVLLLVVLQRSFFLLSLFAKLIYLFCRGLRSLIEPLLLILLKLLEFGAQVLQELFFLLRLVIEVSHRVCVLLSLIR